MQFESFSEFFQMGGHAIFVFSVYLLSVAVVLGNVILPLRQKQRFYAEQGLRALTEKKTAADRTTAASSEPAAQERSRDQDKRESS